jgi:hypothetical protein
MTNATNGRSKDFPSLGEVTAEMLRQTFPEWRIFRSGDTWWAIRGGIQTWDGPRSLLLQPSEAISRRTRASWLRCCSPCGPRAGYSPSFARTTGGFSPATATAPRSSG